MKRLSNNKNENNNKLAKRISLISWALIHNNVISEMVYFIFIVIDFALQFILLFCMYQTDEDSSKKDISYYLKMKDLDYAKLIQQIIAFVYLILILLAFIILIFKNEKSILLNEKVWYMKLLSMMVVSLRTFLYTYIMIIASSSIYSIQNDLSVMKFIEIFLVCSITLLAIVIQYFSAHLLQISVPNKFITWSETTNLTFVFECGYKFFIAFAFNFQDQFLIKTVLIVLCIILQSYKVTLRVSKSIIFKRLISIFSNFNDSLILHLTFFLLIQNGFNNGLQFFYLILTLSPISIGLNFTIGYLYKERRCIRGIERINKDSEKIIAYFEIIRKYVKLQASFNLNSLSQISYYHKITCREFFLQDSQCQYKIKENELQSHDHDSIGYQGLQSDSDIQIRRDNNIKLLKTGDESQVQSSNVQISISNSMINYTEDNLNNNFQFTDQDVVILGGLKQKKIASQKKQRAAGDYDDFMFKNSIFNKKLTTTQKTAVDKIALNKKFELKKKKIRKLLKHLFKSHLFKTTPKDFRIYLLRIYFTVKILKNYNLAHFLMHSFQQHISGFSFMAKNQIYLHIHHFQSKISSKKEQDQQLSSIDLTQLLELNQLLAKFDEKLDQTSENILKFWQSLANEKSDYGIYEKGLKISSECLSIQKIHDEIEKKQGDYREIKFYLTMANFYKNVVFKSSEYMIEINKSIQIEQIRKFAQLNQMSENSIEKGLIITELNIKKPISVQFINKKASKLLQYNQHEVVGISVNQFMPQIIAENHHRFVERFMQTGKYGMINKKTQQFVKQKSGLVYPVWTYLVINYSNLSQLVMIIEQNEDFKMFDIEDSTSILEGHLICNENLQITEASSNFFHLCKIQLSMLKQIKDSIGTNPTIDMLFKEINGRDLKIDYADGNNQFDVAMIIDNNIDIQFENEEYKQEYDIIMEKTQNSNGTLGKKDFNQSEFGSSFANFYRMKIETIYYLEKQMQYKIIALTIPQQEKAISQKFSKTFEDNLDGQETTKRTHNEGINEQEKTTMQEILEPGRLDISSQTSTNSSTISSMEKFNQYFQQINSKRIPITLRFVLQIVLIVMTLTIGTSTVSMILTQSNFTDARDGIKYSNLSITRMNTITQTRLLIKLMSYMAQGYTLNYNEILDDRISFYSRLIQNQMTQLQELETSLSMVGSEIEKKLGNIQVYYLDSRNKQITEQRKLSQAISLYVATGDDLMQKIQQYGGGIMRSQLRYFSTSGLSNITVANDIERQCYFLVENGNQNLYLGVVDYTELFVNTIQEQINKKITFQTAMTWICIGIIFISGLLMIPLFGRIQSRILILMKIFFGIPIEIKTTMITRIQTFKTQLQNYQKVHRMPLKNPLTKTESGKSIKSLKNQIKKKQSGKNTMNQSMMRLKEEALDESSVSNSNEIAEEQIIEDQNKGDTPTIKKNKQLHIHEVQLDEQSLTTIAYFNNFIKKKKILQSLIIITLMVGFSSYFLSTYFMSVDVFSSMKDALEVLQIILQRRPCIENVAHAVRETLIFNERVLVNGYKDEIYSYYSEKCDKIESDYDQRIRKTTYTFLADAYDYITILENGSFCDDVFWDNDGFNMNQTFITSDKCKTVVNGLATTGITNVLKLLYRITYQINVDYNAEYLNKKRVITFDFVIDNLRKISLPFDVLEVIFTKPIKILQEKVIQSMDNYFKFQSLIFILIFCVFMVICSIVIIVFLFCKY